MREVSSWNDSLRYAAEGAVRSLESSMAQPLKQQRRSFGYVRQNALVATLTLDRMSMSRSGAFAWSIAEKPTIRKLEQDGRNTSIAGHASVFLCSLPCASASPENEGAPSRSSGSTTKSSHGTEISFHSTHARERGRSFQSSFRRPTSATSP